MITISGKNQKTVTVIETSCVSLRYNVYVLSDFIKCEVDKSAQKIGWFYLKESESLKPGFYYIRKNRDNLYYLYDYDQRIQVHISSYDVETGMHIDTLQSGYQVCMRMHRKFIDEIKVKDSRIAELEADLELYKSTQEFIEECKKL